MNNLSVLHISIIIVSLIGLISSIISSYYSNKLNKIKARENELLQKQNNLLWDIVKDWAEILKKVGEPSDEVQEEKCVQR